jgi:hypothetical protein
MPDGQLPYKDKMLDGRVKLTDEQRKQIPKDYQQYKSIRYVASLYGVNKRLIQFILYPERYAQFQKDRYKKKVWLKYYDKEKHTLAIRKYRAKKRRLGLLLSQQKNK